MFHWLKVLQKWDVKSSLKARMLKFFLYFWVSLNRNILSTYIALLYSITNVFQVWKVAYYLLLWCYYLLKASCRAHIWFLFRLKLISWCMSSWLSPLESRRDLYNMQVTAVLSKDTILSYFNLSECVWVFCKCEYGWWIDPFWLSGFWGHACVHP